MAETSSADRPGATIASSAILVLNSWATGMAEDTAVASSLASPSSSSGGLDRNARILELAESSRSRAKIHSSNSLLDADTFRRVSDRCVRRASSVHRCCRKGTHVEERRGEGGEDSFLERCCGAP